LSWNISLTDVNPLPEVLPAETFDFELVGAKYSDRDPAKIEVTARVATEGSFQGRKVFFSYPDPAKYAWAPKQLKKLEIVLGVDAQVGEDPVSFLNRASGNYFRSNLMHRSYTPEGASEPITKVEVNIFNPQVAQLHTTSTAA
jgi:hypothetical protein